MFRDTIEEDAEALGSQVGGIASEEVVGLGNEDGTKVGRARQWSLRLENGLLQTRGGRV